MRFLTVILLLILTLVLFTGCAAGVGYVLGYSMDQEAGRSETIPVDSVATILIGQRIFVTSVSGTTYDLEFVDTDTTTSMTVRTYGDQLDMETFHIALVKVERIQIYHTSTKYRTRYAGMGFAVDAIAAILTFVIYSQLSNSYALLFIF